MDFTLEPAQDRSVYTHRRVKLVESIRQLYPDGTGYVVLPAAFECDSTNFMQDSTFYYYTGINEPGLVLVLDLEGAAKLFIPSYTSNRSSWVMSELDDIEQGVESWGFDTIEILGDKILGYQTRPWTDVHAYKNLIALLDHCVARSGKIFSAHESFFKSNAGILIYRLSHLVNGFAESFVDCASIISSMRRVKDLDEIERMYRAIDLTIMGQQAAAQSIVPGLLESELKAQIDYVFAAGAQTNSFPTIVAAGKSATIMHYVPAAKELEQGELVIIDCGARVDLYCGDLTRTYPVSGKFTDRQREIYSIVLEVQEYIATIVMPGYWLSHEEHQELSLNHLAKKYVTEKGYDRYWIHGIGHFLGLDVHDVGDPKEPLREGDIITIEPGLYLPEEGIGIRIEDNYWITKKGALCMSEALPKKPDEIESFMKNKFSDDTNPSDEGECGCC